MRRVYVCARNHTLIHAELREEVEKNEKWLNILINSE